MFKSSGGAFVYAKPFNAHLGRVYLALDKKEIRSSHVYTQRTIGELIGWLDDARCLLMVNKLMDWKRYKTSNHASLSIYVGKNSITLKLYGSGITYLFGVNTIPELTSWLRHEVQERMVD